MNLHTVRAGDGEYVGRDFAEGSTLRVTKLDDDEYQFHRRSPNGRGPNRPYDSSHWVKDKEETDEWLRSMGVRQGVEALEPNGGDPVEVEEGERVRVETQDGSYQGRVTDLFRDYSPEDYRQVFSLEGVSGHNTFEHFPVGRPSIQKPNTVLELEEAGKE